MNLSFAREVGFLNYFWRRVLWKFSPPKDIRLCTDVVFPLPKEKFFASDVFVTNGNVDWNAEYILAAYLSAHQSKGDFIDVGAHIGYYSCLLSPCVERIFAFEPDTRNHQYLRAALDSIPHAELIPKAVADCDGIVHFADQGESSVSHIDPNAPVNSSSVESIKLDTFVQNKNASPVAIKMDIEGFEILALEGARETLISHAPVVLIEFNIEEGRPNTWEILQAFVELVDYVVYAVTREPYGFGYRYRFASHAPDDVGNYSYKMLFLVPSRKRAWFDALAVSHSEWYGGDLRASSVRSFLSSKG